MKDASRFRAYPSYRHLGIDWLEEIPSGWNAERIKFDAPIQTGYAFKSENFQFDGVPVVRMANLKETQLDLSDAVRIPHDNALAEFALKEGDVLMGMSGSIGLTALVRASDLPCQLNQRVGRFRFLSSRVLREFLRYFVRSRVFTERILLNSSGTAQLNVSPEEIGNTWIPIPTLPEQRAIAEFLDREMAQIDELIAKKQRLIDLLEEKRAALITHAVTRGLNPHAPLRDSGIEWLGQIPNHWKTKRLRFVGDATIGLTFDPEDVVQTNEGVQVLRASNVKNGRVVFGDDVFVQTKIPNHLITQVGDILVCSRSGSRALIGKSAQIDTRSAGLTFGTFMTVFRSTANDYLFYVFNSRLFDYQAGAFLTSTINQLTIETLKNFAVPLPPETEQAAIVEYLRCETSKISQLIESVEAAIEKIKEFRSTLITAAVTGKIDLRAANSDL
jgi:type I restriction enzyme S subunit